MTQNRWDRLLENVRSDTGADTVMLVNRDRLDPNFFYLTGYTSGLFEGSYAVMHSDKSVDLLTSELEADIARKWKHRVHVYRGYDDKSVGDQLKEILHGAKKIGVNYRGLSYSDYMYLSKILPDSELVDVSSALSKTRMVKDDDEIELLKTAVKITSDTFRRIPDFLKEGMSEKELQADIEATFVRLGADEAAYSSIVAFGENSALPHHRSSERTLRKGDTVLLDVGAKYKLYCADMTRTFFFGSASDEQKDMYSVVLNAQEAALNIIHDGQDSQSVHMAAQNVIDSSKYKGRFIHGLGHSIGVEVHDGPGMGRRRGGTLMEKMVVTVEPGVYLLGKGGVRIEDDVVVGKNGANILTDLTRDLLVI
ncbi:MAG: Xaa-Pro peptidase family protein [Thermoprotei archaeon]